jgi:uncharacterized protein
MTGQPPASTEPVTSNERISAVDVLRGVVVLGILLINIEDFGLPHADKSAVGTEWIGVYFPAEFSRHLALWTIWRAVFEGKMRAIFSMLFGAGMVLLTSRLERRGEAARAADIYYRRTLWLLAFGVVHAYLFWEGDILYSYAVSGLVLYPFRRLSARALIVIGVSVLAVSVPRAAVIALHRQDLRSQTLRANADETAGKMLGDAQKDARAAWAEIEDTFAPGAETLQARRDDYRGGYARLFARRAQLVMYAESSDYYVWQFFDTFGMMLVGMGLLKLGVLTATRPARFYVAMATIGLGVGVPLSALTNYVQYLKRFDPVAVAWLTAVYDPARLAVALAHIGLVMLVVKAGKLRHVTSSLADVGRMALTNYLATSIICTTLFNGYGFGLFGSLRRGQLYAVVLSIWCVQFLFSRLWLRSFRFGPAEWIWRSLTYWKLQPLRRRDPAGAVAVSGVGT